MRSVSWFLLVQMMIGTCCISGSRAIERVNWKPHYRGEAVPRPGSGGAHYHFLHVKNFVDSVRSRQLPNSDVEIGHNSMIACHLGNIAFRLGRQVRWDVEKETISDDAEARRYLMRQYRAPWKLPAE